MSVKFEEMTASPAMKLNYTVLSRQKSHFSITVGCPFPYNSKKRAMMGECELH